MNPEDVIEPACWLITGLCAVALLLLAKPDSFLSRLVDRPADDTTTIGGPR